MQAAETTSKQVKLKIRKENYTWIPKLIGPRESQWSLLCKFSVWNALTAKKLNNLIGLRKSSYHPINLALDKYIDAERFSKLTGSSIEMIRESLAINYVPDGWGKSLICKSLRYCPACLRQGYHSAIYQIGLITICPIHSIPLLDYCDQCGKTIQTTQPRNNFDNPYVCDCCNVVFCNIMNVGKMVPLDKENVLEINRIGGELDALMNETKKRKIYWGKGQNMSESIDLTYSIYSKCIEEVYRYAGEITIKEAVNISRSLNWDLTRAKPLNTLWVVYRAIRRRILHKVIRHHRNCLHTMNLLGALYAGFSFDGSLGCIQSHAFIMWRMYWEGHANIANLNLNQKVPIKWDQPDVMSDEEILRVFGHDCLASFYAISNKAHEMDRDGYFHLMKREEINALKKDDLFLNNWAIVEGRESKRDNFSNLFTWLDCRDERIFQKADRKHTDELRAARDKIYDAIKKATSQDSGGHDLS